MEDVIEISSDDEGSVRVEDASSDSTEPFSRGEARSRPRPRDPRLGREYYRRQEERAPPRRVHTVLRSTVNVATRMDGLIQLVQARYTTVYIQVPRGGTTPPLVEEPPSPPRPPGSPKSGARRCTEDGAPSRWATPTPWTASEDEEFPPEMDSRSPSRGWEGGREHCPSVEDPTPETAARDEVEEGHSEVSISFGEEFEAEEASPEEGGVASPIPRRLDDGSPSRGWEGGREHCPSVEDPIPETAARDGAEAEQRSVRVEDANPEEDTATDPVPQRRTDDDVERDQPPEPAARVTLRYTPGTVENRRLSCSSQSSAERPTDQGQASRRKRRRRRRRGRPVPAREPDTRAPASRRNLTDGAEGPSARRQRRERSQVGSGRKRDQRQDESTEEERRLLADMAELLDGWEVSLEDALDAEDVEALRMLPLIPVNWRIRPAGVELSEEVIQLLRREVETRRWPHRRTRFRVAAGERSYTVTINSSGGVTVAPAM
ncbi:uncharacterized protein LOC122757822 [Drosophila mojavensis]|uniref:uncharacterized protein LOC122757822 n=1 Tax=Drosophila mojavensis TaxID=7230 RepID=UPI001CD0DFC1|nr:uncharacterized protein LOC122757822 [Drosophila mojavensis]